VNLEQAYLRCEQITTEQARNFSYGIRLLPEPKRKAMSALYAMARRIDDIGDGDASSTTKLADLAAVRKDLAAVATGEVAGGDAVLVALADVARRYPLPLDGYCRRVAGTVGRLSLAVYGTPDAERAAPLADALGVALQITNILRDIVEDHETMGRVYLPEEDRERFGVGPGLDAPPDAMAALIELEAARAEQWYDRGLTLLALLDWRSRACTAAMAGIYRRLLERIRRDPRAVLSGRISLPGHEKAVVAARALVRGRA
jgi:phytoene synthase